MVNKQKINLLEKLSCEEFKNILQKYDDISDIFEDKELSLKFFRHIDSADQKQNCIVCKILFSEKEKSFKKKGNN